MAAAICLVLTIAFAALRFVVPVQGLTQADVFKDLAHVFVGGLFGAGIYGRDRRFIGLAIGLTVVEVIAAFTRSS